eukprot:Trichotokara_eunicae@DN4376_c0_g1_i1.p1
MEDILRSSTGRFEGTHSRPNVTEELRWEIKEEFRSELEKELRDQIRDQLCNEMTEFFGSQRFNAQIEELPIATSIEEETGCLIKAALLMHEKYGVHETDYFLANERMQNTFTVIEDNSFVFHELVKQYKTQDHEVVWALHESYDGADEE